MILLFLIYNLSKNETYYYLEQDVPQEESVEEDVQTEEEITQKPTQKPTQQSEIINGIEDKSVIAPPSARINVKIID